MGLFRFTGDVFNKHWFFANVERVDMLPCPYKKQKFVIRLAIGEIIDDGVFDEFDWRMESEVPHPDGVVFAGSEEEVGIVGAYRDDGSLMDYLTTFLPFFECTWIEFSPQGFAFIPAILNQL